MSPTVVIATTPRFTGKKFVNKNSSLLFISRCFYRKMPSIAGETGEQTACEQNLKLAEDKYPRFAPFKLYISFCFVNR